MKLEAQRKLEEEKEKMASKNDGENPVKKGEPNHKTENLVKSEENASSPKIEEKIEPENLKFTNESSC